MSSLDIMQTKTGKKCNYYTGKLRVRWKLKTNGYITANDVLLLMMSNLDDLGLTQVIFVC